ncbi:neuronal acetylcholine receptor subunit beta-3-like [Pecten maximus]|uniref:neuronal acetylcholine receptor subunit beta-3-like n=1 Tax=Pecten maximus TaxID=6579 RepID=UPI001458B8BC|nr:neuronal acetylcholine receptor subunit beta-3-like [Pecten maximus]
MFGVYNILLVTACVCLNGVQSTTRDDVQKLNDKILNEYKKDLGPNFNQSQPIVLYIQFNLFTLNEFDDKAGKLAFLGYSSIEWRDDRMVWNPLEHGNTTTVMIPQSKVWIPHLFVAKPYTDVKKIGYDFVQVTYTSDGWARWTVPDLFQVSCTADIAYYPMDRQKCEIYIIPWAYGKGTFDFRLPLDTMTQNDFVENGAWKILSTEMHVSEHSDGDLVIMVIKFQRRPLFIILNLILPIVVVAGLNIFVFLLPPDPGERSAFGVTVLLAMAVFLSIVSDKLPSTSEPHIARVSVFILSELIVSALIMVFTVFTLILYNNKDDKPIPDWMKRFVLRCSRRKTTVKKGARNDDDVIEPNRTDPRYWRSENDRYHRDNTVYGKNRGYPNENTDRRHHEPLQQKANQSNSRHTAPEGPVELAADDTNTTVTWNDVAKCFDNACLLLFIFLNVCIVVIEIIDSAYYWNTDF